MIVIVIIIRLFLSAVFLLAGISKLKNIPATQKAVKDFGVPISFTAFVGWALPITEISAALLLLFDVAVAYASILISLLLILFIALISRLIYQNKTIDCNCFGETGKSPTGWHTIYRNGSWLLLAILPLLQSTEMSSMLSWSANEISIGILTTFLLVQTLFIYQLFSKNIQQNDKVNHLEYAVFRGLPIGTKLPDFNGINPKGEAQDLALWIDNQKPTLLLFLAANCSPCESLLPKAMQWHQNHADRFKVIFITQKDEKFNVLNNLDKVHQLIVNDKNLAFQTFKISGFPSAVLIHSNKIIAQRPAAGAERIQKMVDDLVDYEL